MDFGGLNINNIEICPRISSFDVSIFIPSLRRTNILGLIPGAINVIKRSEWAGSKQQIN